MNTYLKAVALVATLGLLVCTGSIWAQDATSTTPEAPAEVAPDQSTQPETTPAPPAETPVQPKKTKKTVEPPSLDYSKELNKSLTSPESKTPATTQPQNTTTLPPSRLYTPYTPPASSPENHVKDVLSRYAPTSAKYTPSQSSYNLLQQQLQRKQLETALTVKLGNIATSNPDLYQQQLKDQVSVVLQQRVGVGGSASTDATTLMNINNNVRPAPIIYPNQYQQNVPSASASGAPGQLSRINANYGNPPGIPQYQGLQKVDVYGYNSYSGYLSREYGVQGGAHSYSVPRAYGNFMMNQDIQYLQTHYGITVDPSRMTYSDLYKLKTGIR